MKKWLYLFLLSIFSIFITPQYSIAIYGVGDYIFSAEYFEKKLQRLLYNLNLQGRQNTLYFNFLTGLEIYPEDKRVKMLNKQLSIYNKLYDLQLGDISFGISQLTESKLNLLGTKLAMIKKSDDKISRPIFFTGKSSNAYITGMKINRESGTKSSHSLFLFNKSGLEDKQVFGGEFKTPIHRFSLLNGEYFLDSKNNKGLLINNLLEYERLTLMTQYSIINKVSSILLSSTYKTNTSTITSEYSKVPQGYRFKLSNTHKIKNNDISTEYIRVNGAGFFQLSNSYKTDNFQIGGVISKKEKGYASEIEIPKERRAFLKESFQYSGYMGYRFKLLKKVAPFILYQHSYLNIPETPAKNIYDGISCNMDYFNHKTQLSISISTGLEATKQWQGTSFKRDLTFKRGIKLDYRYHGFRPYVNYNLTTTEDKLQSSQGKQTTYFSYGISKNITKNLSASFNYLQTAYELETLPQKKTYSRIEKYATMNYKFPKIPITLMTKTSWLNNEKPKWYLSITYRKDKRQDLFKYREEIAEYTTENQFKFGKYPKDIASITEEIPTQEELLKLGSIIIRVFKDEDFDEVFSKEKDIPVKDIKVKLDKNILFTNEEGKVSFVDIPIGTYTLSVELGDLPINLVCKTKVEQEIKIKEGEDIYINFPLIRTAELIKGGVFIDENRNGIWDEDERGAEDILIYANQHPAYTKIDGKYKFRNILPGTVTMRIEVKSLPEDFELTTKESVTIKVLPKQKIDGINFGIAEKVREIEFD